MESNSLSKTCKNLFVPCPENQYRPSFLASKWFYLAIGFLLLLKVVSILISQGYLGASIYNEISRQDIYTLVNEARVESGLNNLNVNSKLEYAAELKLADMKANGYFDHISPAGSTPWTWINKAEYKYSVAGENLAMNFFSSDETFNAWMSSEGHRKNILLADFKDTGIAVGKASINGFETVVIVQMFGKEKSDPVVARVLPTAQGSVVTPTPKVTPKKTPKITPTQTVVAKQNPIVPLQIEDIQVKENSKPVVLDETMYAADNTLKTVMKWVFYLSLLVLALKVLVSIRIQFPTLVLKAVILVALAYVIGFSDWLDFGGKKEVVLNDKPAFEESK